MLNDEVLRVMSGPRNLRRRRALLLVAVLVLVWTGCTSREEDQGRQAPKPAALEGPERKEPDPPATVGQLMPHFSPLGRIFVGRLTVELSAPPPAMGIYFTTDGTEPTRQSMRYRQPLVLDNSTWLRARLIASDAPPGPISSEVYTEVDPDLKGFSSNLPVVLIDTFGHTPRRGRGAYVPGATLIIAPDERSEERATVSSAAHFNGIAGIRIRGRSSSRLWPKLQYALEIVDEQGRDRSVSLLGMPAESDWILLGPYSDKSLLRTVLPYKWSNDIGRYAARTRFIELFLADDRTPISSAHYLGAYVLMEKIKRDPNRVDIEKLEPSHNTTPEITGGYILRKDWSESPLFTTATGMELEYREPKFDEITAAQERYIQSYVDAFEARLYGSKFADPKLGYEQWIDVGSFIDHFVLVELTKNGDAYYHSTYLVKDRGGKLEMGPIWDYNLSMGNFSRGHLSSPEGWYYPVRTQNGTQRWYVRLLENPRFCRRLRQRWSGLRRSFFDTSRLLSDIEQYALHLEEAQRRNFARWDVLGRRVRYNPPGWQKRRTYRAEIDFLKDWLVERLEWLDGAIENELAAKPR